jgi:hypothetical protein
MVDAGLSTTRHWVLGAVFAVLSSLVYAKGPPMHDTNGGHGGYEGGRHAMRRVATSNDVYRVENRRGDHGNRGDRGDFLYAGAITTVSAETRSAPRPPEDESLVRAGSIRADVARYNEERGSSRPPPRPPEYMSRPPGPSPYRN